MHIDDTQLDIDIQCDSLDTNINIVPSKIIASTSKLSYLDGRNSQKVVHGISKECINMPNTSNCKWKKQLFMPSEKMCNIKDQEIYSNIEDGFNFDHIDNQYEGNKYIL